MKDAIYFLISTLLELVVLTFILRLLLQTVRADFYNPISQAILRITNPWLFRRGVRFPPGVGWTCLP